MRVILPNKNKEPKLGLVLTGGGSRAAYQAGAFLAVMEIAASLGKEKSFKIISGTSAGAINASFLASNMDNPKAAAEKLADLWGNLKSDQIYYTDAFSFARLASRWVVQVTTGNVANYKLASSLFHTDPLRLLLRRHVSLPGLAKNIEQGVIDALALTTVNYDIGNNITFFMNREPGISWKRHRRIGIREEITVDHILASASIPVLFPPVQIGNQYFGDGSVRNYYPLSPAIKLGARKILVIGVNRSQDKPLVPKFSNPSMGRILSVLLNSILMDSIDLDLERLMRLNNLLQAFGQKKNRIIKKIDTFVIRPSEDIGKIASYYGIEMAPLVQYLLSGIGNSEDSADLFSYLLFEGKFTRKLVELGYEDTMSRKTAVETFFNAESK